MINVENIVLLNFCENLFSWFFDRKVQKYRYLVCFLIEIFRKIMNVLTANFDKCMPSEVRQKYLLTPNSLPQSPINVLDSFSPEMTKYWH